MTDAVVRRDDLHELRFADTAPRPLANGEARLRVDSFAFTSNNVTYAVFGEAMKYWDFFPAAEPGWGRVPVWGFADVVESTTPGVLEGQRVYGYLPMSTELVVRPARVSDRGFMDSSEHRRAMASAYSEYTAVATDPAYDADHEAAQMLLRPLLYTAFFLAERGDVEVVGLTSPGNVAFVESLGVYGRVLAYDDVASVPVVPAVFIDIAGDAGVRSAVHRHFGDDLVHSSVVGGTHWDAPRPDDAGGPLPGASPSFFFAPDQGTKRAEEWGAAKLDEAFGAAWRRAVAWSDGWLEVRESRGPDAVRAAYLEVLDGASPPSVGHVLSLHD